MKTTKKVAILVALLLLLQMAFSLTGAAETVAAKTPAEGRYATVVIEMCYRDAAGDLHPLQYGSGFFIAERYVVTAFHNTTLSEEQKAHYSNSFGQHFVNQYGSNFVYRVLLSRNASVEARRLDSASSEVSDFAVLHITEALNVPTILALGDTKDVFHTMDVHLLGFPDLPSGLDISQVNESADVTITSGNVEKMTFYEGTSVIQHSSLTTPGNSGGPLVSNEGVVYGICKGVMGDYCYAVDVNLLRDNLTRFNIPYTAAETPGAIAEPTIPDVEICTHVYDAGVTEKCITTYTCTICADKKTEGPNHTFGEWDEVTPATRSVKGVKERVCSVCQEKETEDIPVLEKNNNVLLIIIVLAVVVVVILVVIVLVAMKGKKKSIPQPIPSQMPGQPAMNYAGRPGMQTPPPPPPHGRLSTQVTSVPQGAGLTGATETTVLSDGAGQTTVLGGNAATPCTLVRRKNGEKVPVHGDEFIIGKERRRVNYCIDDNTSISRTHVKIVRKGNAHYVIDLNSTNFTFVNGIKVTPGQEYEIKSGDKLKLSDEEFTFNT